MRPVAATEVEEAPGRRRRRGGGEQERGARVDAAGAERAPVGGEPDGLAALGVARPWTGATAAAGASEK